MNEEEQNKKFEERAKLAADLAAKQRMEQDVAMAGDMIPLMWRRIYLNCMESGFSKEEAFQLLKCFISRRETP
jgi:hypothetical protein